MSAFYFQQNDGSKDVQTPSRREPVKRCAVQQGSLQGSNPARNNEMLS
jgi:hypothetical protein